MRCAQTAQVHIADDPCRPIGVGEGALPAHLVRDVLLAPADKTARMATNGGSASGPARDVGAGTRPAREAMTCSSKAASNTCWASLSEPSAVR
ncbi:hypothetical protein sS8_5110 [Methylocaldum marinum]|uniref:Uncharacterized protein n=1 Tax=Methylocaldum marinum TaxID=1432792 RepID=A0A250KZK8_9GAMM|nr:hypothetical protein sS8_5110 [Methylocaldum marinum]